MWIATLTGGEESAANRRWEHSAALAATCRSSGGSATEAAPPSAISVRARPTAPSLTWLTRNRQVCVEESVSPLTGALDWQRGQTPGASGCPSLESLCRAWQAEPLTPHGVPSGQNQVAAKAAGAIAIRVAMMAAMPLNLLEILVFML